MRIIHITGVPEGGVFALLTSLHENIDRDRLQFDYAMPEGAASDAAARRVETLGGRAFKYPALKYQNYFKLNGFFDRFFAEHPEYRIAHVHGPNIAVVCLKNAKKNGVPHRLCHSHNTKYADTPIRALRNKLLLAGLDRVATDYIACSEKAGLFLFGDKQLYILKNGIAAEKFTFNPQARDEIRETLGLGDSFEMGAVGLLRKQKNHAFMLRILQSYRELFGDGKLLIVGGGELRGELEGLANELKVRDHVVFAGARRDVPGLLSAMDVFLMPSFYEGLGIALVEAQASGLPCAYSDTIPEDARLTDLALPLSLNQGAEAWAREVHAMRELPRRSRVDDITAAGYDVRSSAEELTQYYTRLVEGTELD
jgi:glycosyltransferase involved in cell wall biosynthesis